MPDWFAKTKEMMASDLYFSLVDAGTDTELIRRYHQALHRLNTTPSDEAPQDSYALQRVWKNPGRVSASIGGHFIGDWIYYRYYMNKALFANKGGAFWPDVPSSVVVDQIREGTIVAIHKALGATELSGMSGLSTEYLDDLWEPELKNDVDIDGVRPLATSWNCVAPAGSKYFETAALRGPTIVEFAIATPKPYEHSSMAHVVEKRIDKHYARRKPSARKASARKPPARKASVQQPARKASAQKPARKASARKPPARKASPRKPSAGGRGSAS
jgi:hypothetical protein